MATKEELLKLFENNKGVYLSGEEIAEKLSLSRTAVWKAVNSLRKDGYRIDAVQNKGYCLAIDTDILSAEGILKYLEPVCSNLELTVLPVTDSTNSLLREMAAAGAPEGRCVIANSQTTGRGRLGRVFYSPADTGVYLSLLLRPGQCSAEQASKLTTMAAVAACEAIEDVSDEKASIKWVNDIYMNDRKVSGILTEASFDLESGYLEYAALGIGINIYPPNTGFPEEIKDIAGAVFRTPRNDGKNRVAAAFLNHFMEYYTAGNSADYAVRYRDRSFLIGRDINVLFRDGKRSATAIDVDQDCHLIVRYEDGSEDCLSSGEVSLRLADK